MDVDTAATALSALGHVPRLEVFRLLIRAGHGGMPAGEIARQTGVVQNTLSSYLATLKAAGLVASRRDGRSIIYTAAYQEMSDLIGFLTDECCGDDPNANCPVIQRVGGRS